MDEDDRPGYLMDFVKSWAKENDITDRASFNDSFQSDSFRDGLEDFVEEVLETAGVIEGE